MTTEAEDAIGRSIPAVGQGYCSSIAISGTVTIYPGFNGVSSTVGPTTETITMAPDADCYVLLSDLASPPLLNATNGEFIPASTKYTRKVTPGTTRLQALAKTSTTGLLNIVEDT